VDLATSGLSSSDTVTDGIPRCGHADPMRSGGSTCGSGDSVQIQLAAVTSWCCCEQPRSRSRHNQVYF
jgi:hypothetical protein